MIVEESENWFHLARIVMSRGGQSESRPAIMLELHQHQNTLYFV